VASGHPLTTAAGCEALRRGGNAFDAAVAAGFAATVTEPYLTSLGGGGFLLAHEARSGRDRVFDFFVNAPGKGLPEVPEPILIPVEVRFPSTVQVFHAGSGSVAVPGTLKGLLHVWQELGTMKIEDIMAPALRFLDEGIEIRGLQRHIIGMLSPILTLTDYGREVFGGSGDRLFNPLYREFLGTRDPEQWLDIFYGSGADAFEAQMREDNGLVTAQDLHEYAIAEHEPLRFSYRGHEVVTNPAPSVGGRLLRTAFAYLARQPLEGTDDARRLLALAGAMRKMNELRNGTGGTTHVSVLDRAGNAASMTASNGSNSGIFLGRTGVMLNNMMGEDDLHPAGFHTEQPGTRVGSMMSPTLLRRRGDIVATLGSGGSKRIKTAMLQTIHNLLDRRMSAEAAVEAPRIHLDDEGVLQTEPGIAEDPMRALEREFRVNRWAGPDLYFGGVHVVTADFRGAGDPRRRGGFALAEGEDTET
jgi:gamma-glutamyltranspeptidase/glutathione hydrolase